MSLRYVEYKLEDGKNVRMTLNFGLLYKLRAADRKTYDNLNKVLIKGQKEVLDSVDLLYGAYKCANLSESMSKENFIEKMNKDFGYNNESLKRLTNQRKK
ncbi:MAG: hypothetical protein ACOX1S_05320 [Anaerostipes sp.]|jgi:hypothetical protein|nr:hypothetical protein [Anaerostipes sp.]